MYIYIKDYFFTDIFIAMSKGNKIELLMKI